MAASRWGVHTVDRFGTEYWCKGEAASYYWDTYSGDDDLLFDTQQEAEKFIADRVKHPRARSKEKVA